jgi:pilus assembly protein CpaD
MTMPFTTKSQPAKSQPAKSRLAKSQLAKSQLAKLRLAVWPIAAVAVLSIGACAPNNRLVINPESDDYRQNHPIVLSQADRTIDIFVAGGPGAIGGRQISDIRSFAQEYRRSGKGALVIAKPINDPETGRIIPAIRQALAEGGVPSAAITSYAPTDPSETAPVKLTFATLKANVADQCGRYPTDLNGINNFEGWKNTPPENFGCATQTALAAQVADPLDLVRPRPEGSPSATRTTTVLTKFGKGEPTTVIYPDDSKNKIDKAVGQ